MSNAKLNVYSATGPGLNPLARGLSRTEIDANWSALSDHGYFVRGLVAGAGGEAANNAVLDEFITAAAVLTMGVPIHLPAGDYYVSGRTINHVMSFIGHNTRLLNAQNSPVFSVAAGGVVLRDIGFLGDGDAAKTAQCGVYIGAVNSTVVDGCNFDNLYRHISGLGASFYTRISRNTWLRATHAAVYLEGNTSAGFDVALIDNISHPTGSQFSYYFKNYGSVQINVNEGTPTLASTAGIVFDTPAALAGLQLIHGVTVEESSAVGLKITSETPGCGLGFRITGSYFAGAAGNPGIYLKNTDSVSIDSTYLTTGAASGSGIEYYGDNTNLTISGTKFAVTDYPIHGNTSATMKNLTILAPQYSGSKFFLHATGTSAIGGVTIYGGTIGTNATPIPGASAYSGLKVRGVQAVGGGMLGLYEGGGVSQHNGGASSFTISTGLVSPPTRYTCVPASADAGTAEISNVTISGNNLVVATKASAAAGTNNVKWSWTAEV